MIDKIFYTAGEKRIALTFDDGPDKIFTEWLLDVLKGLDISVTFFCVGNRINKYPTLIGRMINEKHLVCNHSYSHPHMGGLSAADIKTELINTNSLIKCYAGYSSIFFRPPYGEDYGEVAPTARSLGFEVIKWDKDTFDWNCPPVSDIVNSLLSAKDKMQYVILCHDGLDVDGAGCSHRCQTINAVKEAIPKLKEAGCKFVTYAELKNINSLYYGKGQSNAIAMDTSGNCISVEVNGGKLFCRVGKGDFVQKTILWGDGIQYGEGMSNAVSMDWSGNCIEVHQVQDVPYPILYYKVGKLDTTNKKIVWENSIKYDDGGPNAIALGGNGRCVEVHVGGSTLYYRVGTLDLQNKVIKFGSSLRYDVGQRNAIAIDSNANCIEVHVNSGKLYYRVGKADFTANTINWGECILYDSGDANAISLDPNRRCVEVHSKDGKIFYRSGKADFNEKKSIGMPVSYMAAA